VEADIQTHRREYSVNFGAPGANSLHAPTVAGADGEAVATARDDPGRSGSLKESDKWQLADWRMSGGRETVVMPGVPRGAGMDYPDAKPIAEFAP
jgi:hypothetical protein